MTRLDEIKARLAAATPGPWDEYVPAMEYEDSCFHGRGPDADTEYMATNDCALIAHAPADIAYLVGRVERMEAFVRAWDEFDRHACSGCADCDRRLDEWRRHQDRLEKHVDEARAALEDSDET